MVGIKLFSRLLVVVFFVSCATSKKEAEKKSILYHRIATSFIQQCKYRPALKELQKALSLDSRSQLLHHSIALVYFQFKEYNKAIKHLRKAISLEPGFTKARVHLARALIEVDQLEEALKALNHSLQDLTFNNPETIQSFIALAYFRQKKFSKAEAHFSVAGKILQKDCFVSLFHAKTLYFLNRFDEALTLLDKSKKLCDTNKLTCSSPLMDPYYFAALIYKKKEQKKKAIRNLKVFLKKAMESEYLTQAQQLMKLWSKP